MNIAAFASLPPSACTMGAQGDHGPDRIARNIYDAAGQRLQVRAGVGTAIEGATATWAYNGTGQVTAVIDGNGNRAQLVYDGHGRQICWMFPSTTRPSAYEDATQASALASAGALSGTISNGQCASGDYEAYEYDPNGNRTNLRRRDGVTLTYQYDALGRVTVKIVPERPAPHPYPLTAAQTRDVHYGYDLRNLQLFARFDSISGEGVTSQYDGFGRLASSTILMDGAAHSFAYHYDRNGNRIWFDGTSGYYSARTYDGLDRVTSVVDPHGTVVRIGYDAAGRRSGLDSGLTPTSATSLGYDGIGRLASLGHDFAGTGNDVAWSYVRNPASGIGSVTRNNDAYAWTSHYAVQRAYTANGLNQYTNAGSAGFTYDANGNLITSPGPNPQETLTYTYDAENRLVGRTSNGPSPTVTLAYDPLGRLWRVQGAAGTTRFLYDGDALAIETDGAGSVLRAFAHGPGSDEPLVWYEVPGGWRRLYPRADHQGSIVAAGGDNGALALINRYDEYGIPAGTNTGRFQYTGQIWLPELGLYHYKARIYSPTLGRFLQTDPVGYQDQFNLYAYVGNDPVNLVDPTGQFRLRGDTPSEGMRFVNSINPISRTQYRVDPITNDIRPDVFSEPNLSGSPTLSSDMDAMIAHPRNFIVDYAFRVRDNGQLLNVDLNLGGGVTFPGNVLDPDTRIILSGNGSFAAPAEGGGKLYQPPSWVAMHEVVVEAAPRNLGEISGIARENRVLEEIGDSRRRAVDPRHPY